MNKCIAERKLLFSKKEDDNLKEVTIKIGEPYLLKNDDVAFEFTEGTAGCNLEFEGMNEVNEIVYGADLIQALQLAVDIEPLIKSLSKKYNFYFPSGEPYFESD